MNQESKEGVGVYSMRIKGQVRTGVDYTLKDHVSGDIVPYLCTLCTFKCQDSEALH